MKRFQLEHLIKAAGTISVSNDIVVVGSQAILGTDADPDARLIRSEEADIYPKACPELSNLIDGSIGELSPFHETFGYYAHGVGPETATLPLGWPDRLLAVRSEYLGSITAWCLEVHDLAASKLVAARPKDIEYVKVLISEGYLDKELLLARIITLDSTAAVILRVRQQAELLFNAH